MHYVRVSKQYYCGVDLHADVMYVCVMTKNDAWLIAHPNVHFHFTPTSASWLNQVEI